MTQTARCPVCEGQVRDLGLQEVGGYNEPSFVRRSECADCDWVSVETVRRPSG